MKNHLPKAKFKVVNVCVLQNEVHSTPKKHLTKPISYPLQRKVKL